MALDTARIVMSSKVGPRPPDVIRKSGLRLRISFVTKRISSTRSPTVVTRLTDPPSRVILDESQVAFVFRVLPSNSSFPIQRSSTPQVNVRHLKQCGAYFFESHHLRYSFCLFFRSSSAVSLCSYSLSLPSIRS